MEIGELVVVMFDFSGGGGRLVFRSVLPGILVMRTKLKADILLLYAG